MSTAISGAGTLRRVGEPPRRPASGRSHPAGPRAAAQRGSGHHGAAPAVPGGVQTSRRWKETAVSPQTTAIHTTAQTR